MWLKDCTLKTKRGNQKQILFKKYITGPKKENGIDKLYMDRKTENCLGKITL